jgi:hypothetical protein
MTKVLSLYGVVSLFIDGNMSFEKRNGVVSRFHEPDAPRVLIFSSVGSAGLNLSLAHVVIFLVRTRHVVISKASFYFPGNRISPGVPKMRGRFVVVPIDSPRRRR